jgi:hypothetical protein
MSIVQQISASKQADLVLYVENILSYPSTHAVLVISGQADVEGEPVQITSNAAFQANMILDLVRSDTRKKLDTLNKFNELSAKWKKERGISSSLSKAAMSPSYQKIIGLGPDVIPLILRRLREEGDHPDFWFWALESLTGENPVSEDDRGKFRAMAKAWLAWGQSNAKLGSE